MFKSILAIGLILALISQTTAYNVESCVVNAGPLEAMREDSEELCK